MNEREREREIKRKERRGTREEEKEAGAIAKNKNTTLRMWGNMSDEMKKKGRSEIIERVEFSST